MRVLVACPLAIVVALAAAVPVAAAPRLWIESVVLGEEFGTGGRCFSPGTQLAVNGAGFTPRRPVSLAGRRVRAGADGTIGGIVRVPDTRRAQERFAITARQGARRSRLRGWVAEPGVAVPGWELARGERLGTPGKVERVRAAGFPPGTLWVHYLLDGRQVFAQRVARLQRPCGAATFRMVQFPFAGVRAGVYEVDFGGRPTADPDDGVRFRGVRIGTPPHPLPPQTATLFTVAGDGGRAPAAEGSAATAVGVAPSPSVDAMPDGGFVVADGGWIRRVHPDGRITVVAGTGRRGSTGDGGPARAARVAPDGVAVGADGSVAFIECRLTDAGDEHGRLRRIAPDGTVRTVVTRRRPLGCMSGIAAAPDSGWYVTSWSTVDHVAGDGRVRTIAGNGESPEGPVTTDDPRRVPLDPSGVATLADGSVLIGDDGGCRVHRLAGGRLTTVAGDGTEGALPDDGARAVDAALCPVALAPAPDGGFVVVDAGYSRATGSQPRVRRVTPDGRIVTIAGTGRFAPDPTRGDELRADGMPAVRADLRFVRDVAVLAGGGIIFAEGVATEGSDPPLGVTDTGLVRYIPAPSPELLAVAVRRDRDRLFTPGAPAGVAVALTAPAHVTVSAGGATVHADLPAGESRVGLPPFGPEPVLVRVTARDHGQRVAQDDVTVYPRGWLTETLAETIAEDIIFSAARVDGSIGDGVGACRRFGPARVDCELEPDLRCLVIVTVRLDRQGRLWWGTYRCGLTERRRLIKPLRRLQRRHYVCSVSDPDCPPPVFGVVAPRWLLPWE